MRALEGIRRGPPGLPLTLNGHSHCGAAPASPAGTDARWLAARYRFDIRRIVLAVSNAQSFRRLTFWEVFCNKIWQLRTHAQKRAGARTDSPAL
jgi:hypothetical protein